MIFLFLSATANYSLEEWLQKTFYLAYLPEDDAGTRIIR